MDTKQRVSIVATLLASVGLGGLVGIITAISAIFAEEGAANDTTFIVGAFGIISIMMVHIAFWDEAIPARAVVPVTVVGAVLGVVIGYIQAMDQPLPMMGELYFGTHWPVFVGIIIMRYLDD